MGANSQVLEAHEVEFYTLDELANRWRTTYRNLHRKVKERKLKVLRLGGSLRVSRKEVQRIEEHGF